MNPIERDHSRRSLLEEAHRCLRWSFDNIPIGCSQRI